MNPIDEEDFEIRNLYIEDAREHFVKGATGNEVIAKLRLANFEFMMKEYDQVETILKEIVFENSLFGRDKEFARKMAKLEKLFFETISDVFDRQSLAEKTGDIKSKFFIERAYRYGSSQGVSENQEGHVQPRPLIDIEKNFLEFLSKKVVVNRRHLITGGIKLCTVSFPTRTCSIKNFLDGKEFSPLPPENFRSYFKVFS